MAVRRHDEWENHEQTVPPCPDPYNHPDGFSGGHVFADDPTFEDVPFDHPNYPYIAALTKIGYVAGCSADPLRFYPERPHTHAEACVFFLRMLYGADFEPPTGEGIFADVDYDNAWYGDWVDAA